jgi:hypothetical protein
MTETPYNRYSYPDEGEPNWNRDEGPENIWEQQEIEITGEVEQYIDLPDPDPSAETDDGQRRTYLVSGRKTIYRDTGSEWDAIAGVGDEAKPLPGTSHFERAKVYEEPEDATDVVRWTDLDGLGGGDVSNPLEEDVDAGGQYTVTNLREPDADSDAATREFVLDNSGGTGEGNVSNPMTEDLDVAGHDIEDIGSLHTDNVSGVAYIPRSVTDFETALENHLSAEANLPIVLPPGRFDISTLSHIIDRPTTLIGQGPNATVLTGSAENTDTVFDVRSSIDIRNVGFESLGAVFDANAHSGVIDRVKLQNVHFDDCHRGLHWSVTTADVGMSHLRIDGLKSTNMRDVGPVYLSVDVISNAIVNDCYIDGAARRGIMLGYSQATRVGVINTTDCEIKNISAAAGAAEGILINRADVAMSDKVVVRDVDLTAGDSSAIYHRGCDESSMTNCHAIDAGGDQGALLSKSHETTIENCVVRFATGRDESLIGIRSQGEQTKIRGCRVFNATDRCFWVYESQSGSDDRIASVTDCYGLVASSTSGNRFGVGVSAGFEKVRIDLVEIEGDVERGIDWGSCDDLHVSNCAVDGGALGLHTFTGATVSNYRLQNNDLLNCNVGIRLRGGGNLTDLRVAGSYYRNCPSELSIAGELTVTNQEVYREMSSAT